MYVLSLKLIEQKHHTKKVRKTRTLGPFGTKSLKIRKKIKIYISTKPGIYVILINKESLYLKFERKNSKNEARNAKSKIDLILTLNDLILTKCELDLSGHKINVCTKFEID